MNQNRLWEPLSLLIEAKENCRLCWQLVWGQGQQGMPRGAEKGFSGTHLGLCEP